MQRYMLCVRKILRITLKLPVIRDINTIPGLKKDLEVFANLRYYSVDSPVTTPVTAKRLKNEL
jgi:hypothetical protein